MILRAENLYKSYEAADTQKVLKGLSLELCKKDCVALLGASGSGKSTLLNCLGLLDRPETGQIEILGQDVLAMNESERAEFRLQNLGFVFQFHHLIPELNAIENVVLPSTLKGKPNTAKAAELLEWVGLENKQKRYPWQLSGGEQQRVAIARALINEPEILLSDEATGNLDRQRAQEILDLLLKVNREWGSTLISVTHDVELAGQYKRQYHLKDGRI